MPKNSSEKILASPPIWIAEFTIPLKFSDYFTESLDDLSIGIKCYEPFEDSENWIIRAYFNEKPDAKLLQSKVKILSDSINLPIPKVEVSEIENKNWVEEMAKEFKAISASKFYIYSQFSEPSPDLLNIKINPGMAFGTGQHETTYLCLEAIGFLLDEKQTFKTALDLGCGSGILAIAAAKVWHLTATATDNDPIAVTVTAENAEENNVILNTFVSEGFSDIKAQKFDLILANILMNPLLQMANELATYASNRVILSGFKTDQVEKILEKYSSLGFKSERMFVKNHWVSLLLSK